MKKSIKDIIFTLIENNQLNNLFKLYKDIKEAKELKAIKDKKDKFKKIDCNLDNLKNKINDNNNKLFEIIENDIGDDILKIAYLTEGFTGRDIRNITKIMVKLLINNNIDVNFDNNKLLELNSFQLFLKAKIFLKELEELEETFVNQNLKDIKSIFFDIFYSLDKKVANLDLNKIISEIKDEDKYLFFLLDKYFTKEELEKEIFGFRKDILGSETFVWKTEEEKGTNISYFINFYSSIVDFSFFKKIFNLIHILENINTNTYFNAIEEYIIGKDKGIEVNDDDLYRIAVHELGHAINGQLAGKNVIKVAIGSKNMSLGQTFSVEKEAKLLKKREDFEKEITELLGGRAAELIMLGDYTTGASNDYERATKTALQFFLNNMEYVSKKHGKLKIGVLINPSDQSMKDYLDNGIRQKALEYSKIMIEELEEKTNKNITKNKKIIKEYADYLINEKILIDNKLNEFLSKIKNGN